MGDSSSVNVILEFLKSNNFSKAEAALRSEIGNRSDINGFMEGLKLEEEMAKSGTSGDVSKDESVVKEMEFGNGRNRSDSKWKNVVKEKNGTGEPSGTRDKSDKSSDNLDETVLDLYSRKFSSGNGSVDIYQNDVKEYQVSSQSKIHSSELADNSRVNAKVGVETDSSADRKLSLVGNGSSVKASGVTKQLSADKVIEPKEFNRQHQVTGAVSRDGFVDKLRNGEWKDCSIKTVFPFPKGDASTSYDNIYGVGEKEDGIRKLDNNIRAAIKDRDDEVGKTLYLSTNEGNNESKAFGGLGFPIISEKHKEELPRLPPVKLKSEDKPSIITWEEKYQRDGPGSKTINADSSYLIGSFLDVPIGQELSTSGLIVFIVIYLLVKFFKCI